MIPIGARVRLSAAGRYRYRDSVVSPHYLTGVIINNNFTEAYEYKVLWEGNFWNAYQKEDIELVKPLTLEDLI